MWMPLLQIRDVNGHCSAMLLHTWPRQQIVKTTQS